MSWSFERRSFAKLLGGRAGRGAHLCWTGGIPSFSSTRSLIRSMESVGSMSISISLPVRVFTLIWGEEEQGACCQFWALGGQRALDSGDAPSSWQIGFWVVAVEAGCVGAGARVCGRRLCVWSLVARRRNARGRDPPRLFGENQADYSSREAAGNSCRGSHAPVPRPQSGERPVALSSRTVAAAEWHWLEADAPREASRRVVPYTPPAVRTLNCLVP